MTDDTNDMVKRCLWKEDEGLGRTIYLTQCGGEWCVNEEMFKENKYKFCPTCGHGIIWDLRV